MAEGAADSVEIRWARELHEDTIVDLIKLGDLARSTLGLLPHAVYREAAERNQIVAALSGGRAVAYVLFRLPRDEVVLTHLCVDPEFRRSGIAKALVDEVSQEHRHRLGIKAKCRNDYNLDGVWRRLGFDVRGPTKGRGRDQAAMTVWWLDHGHPDLFTPPAEEATPVRVALDANIVLDLHGPASASRASRSEVLKAPHLADRIQLVLTRAVDRDIQIRSDDQRQRLRVAMELYTRVPTSPRAKTLFDQMLTAVQREFPNYPVTPQDEADLWHLAEAASAGVDAFVTWDRNLRQKIAPLALGGLADKRLGRLCVLDPYHLEPHLEELSNAAAYSPDALLGSALTSTRAGANFDATLTSFLQKQLGEKWAELSQLDGRAHV